MRDGMRRIPRSLLQQSGYQAGKGERMQLELLQRLNNQVAELKAAVEQLATKLEAIAPSRDEDQSAKSNRNQC